MRAVITVAAATAVALGLLAGPASAATTPVQSLKRSVKVAGHDRKGHKFTGTYTIQRFAHKGNRLYAIGTVRGRMAGHRYVKRNVRRQVVRNTGGGLLGTAAATCTILDLTIRPIDLNLLGLKVHLDRVHLLVTGQTGSGNLLGNLLCGITGILDPSTAGAGQLAQLLNGILGVLQPATL
ncbi:MAG TPA: hypothetical protein VGI54_06005 [Solirubrobacteraceae bacterium]|jgi:hypothetical protein